MSSFLKPQWLAVLVLALLVVASHVGAETDGVERLEQRVLERINEVRRQHDLNDLAMDSVLREVARQYSAAMGRRDFFSHSGPEGDTVGDRLRAAGVCYRMVAENLAKNYNVPDPVTAAVDGWMDSPGHRRNILTPAFRQTGIGVWRDGETFYFTQVFVRALPEQVKCEQWQPSQAGSEP